MSELIGIDVLETVHPADRDEVRRFVDPAARLGRSIRVEMRLLRRDGTPVWVDLGSSLLCDDHARPLCFFTQALDIGARREAEQRAELQAAQNAAVAAVGRTAVQGAPIDALSDQLASAAAELLALDLAAVLSYDRDTRCCRAIAAQGAAAELVDSSRAGRREPFGVLLCESRRRRVFSRQDVNFLRGLASMLAATVEQRRSQDEASHGLLHDSLTRLPNRVLCRPVQGYYHAPPMTAADLEGMFARGVRGCRLG